jgi:hypothetical protein
LIAPAKSFALLRRAQLRDKCTQAGWKFGAFSKINYSFKLKTSTLLPVPGRWRCEIYNSIRKLIAPAKSFALLRRAQLRDKCTQAEWEFGALLKNKLFIQIENIHSSPSPGSMEMRNASLNLHVEEVPLRNAQVAP